MAQAAQRAAIGGDTYEETLSRATTAHGEGRLEEAEHLYGALLDEPQAQVGVLHYVLGMLHAQRGDKGAALNAYDKARWAGFAAPDLCLARADLVAPARAPHRGARSLRPLHRPRPRLARLAQQARGGAGGPRRNSRRHRRLR